MKCPYCGFEMAAAFNQCPACGRMTQAASAPTAASAPAASNTYTYGAPSAYPYTVTAPAAVLPQERTGGEKAAIAVAIVVSALSIVVGFFVFASLVTRTKDSSDDTFEPYGYDAFDDSDSNDYLDKYFNEYYGNGSSADEFSYVSPADLHTPILFEDEFYSFSEGDVKTKYNVEIEQTYRGQAALRLLDGAPLPQINEETAELLLVKFRVKIVEQEKEAIISLHYTLPAAVSSMNKNMFYESLDDLDYQDNLGLISGEEEGTRWIAFIVDKTDPSPLIMWYKYDERYFCDKTSTVTDPAGLEAGAAMEKKSASHTAG